MDADVAASSASSAVAVRDLLEAQLAEARSREASSSVYVERLTRQLGQAEEAAATLRERVATLELQLAEERRAHAAVQSRADDDSARLEAALHADGGRETRLHEAVGAARSAKDAARAQRAESAVVERVLCFEIGTVERRLGRLERQRDTARAELSLARSQSESSCGANAAIAAAAPIRSPAPSPASSPPGSKTPRAVQSLAAPPAVADDGPSGGGGGAVSEVWPASTTPFVPSWDPRAQQPPASQWQQPQPPQWQQPQPQPPQWQQQQQPQWQQQQPPPPQWQQQQPPQCQPDARVPHPTAAGRLPPAPALSAQRGAELYAAAAQDGGAAQVALRLVQYETALGAERRRAHQALAACRSSETRAKQAEAMVGTLSSQMRVVSVQKGQLAVSLDASLRQLGSAHSELHTHKAMQRSGGAVGAFEVQPSSWSLLHDLHQLHLKLHDAKPPKLGSPPRSL